MNPYNCEDLSKLRPKDYKSRNTNCKQSFVIHSKLLYWWGGENHEKYWFCFSCQELFIHCINCTLSHTPQLRNMSTVFIFSWDYFFNCESIFIILGTIFILRKDLGVGGWSRKWQFFITLCTENVITYGMGGSKKAKTPLRSIKMVP